LQDGVVGRVLPVPLVEQELALAAMAITNRSRSPIQASAGPTARRLRITRFSTPDR
jgi:hypothetical protein